MTAKTATASERVFSTRAAHNTLVPGSKLASNRRPNAEERERRFPAFISADEAYYWSRPWQRDVIESMDALRRGDYEDFDSEDPNDVVRWLLSVDEDDDD